MAEEFGFVRVEGDFARKHRAVKITFIVIAGVAVELLYNKFVFNPAVNHRYKRLLNEMHNLPR